MKLPTLEAGYWISPRGKFFLVEMTHIETIINHSLKFGTNEESLMTVFDAHDEPYGIEGSARIQIILCLARKGWIRCRNYGNRGWTLNVSHLTARSKAYITNFFLQLYSRRMGYDDVRIDHVDGMLRTKVPDILAFGLFGGKPSKAVREYTLTFLESPSLIPGNEVVKVRFTLKNDRPTRKL